MSLTGAGFGRGRLSALPARWRTVALLVPLVVLDIAVFLVPMGYLLRISLAGQTTGGAFAEGTWSVDGYRYLAETPLVHEIFGFTLLFGVLVTALAVGIAVVYAYAAWRATGPIRTLLLGGAVLSLFTTIVVKLFAVILVFSPRGVLNNLLTAGLLAEPVLLIDNLTGAVIGQLYIVVPYAILSVYAVLSTLDEQLVEAALDLGADRTQVFREVVLPHVRPGVGVAAIISFTWSVGAYPGPLLLGSGSEQTTAILISQLLLTEFDWPPAAALAVVTVAVVLATLVVGLWRLDGGELLD